MHVICQLALSSNYTALRYIARKCVTKFMFALSASYTTFFLYFSSHHTVKQWAVQGFTILTKISSVIIGKKC